MRKAIAFRVLGLSIALLSACSHAPSTPVQPHKIDHLVLIVFDSMRPDYIDRFELPNFRKLRSLSQNYTNAYVGYLSSETAVSHIVIPTGAKPKDLPWQDDVFYDQAGKLGTPDTFYSTAGLTLDQTFKLLKPLSAEQYLPFQLKKRFGGKVFAVGEKNFATWVFGGPYADRIVTVEKKDGICHPDGVNVPPSILNDPRFVLDCHKKYGTDSTYYPLDGDHYVPGNDERHVGGDPWVFDVTKTLTERERDWSGLFLTFGALDKVSHMLGESDGARPAQTDSIQTPYTLETVARVSDAQLGRVFEMLKDQQLSERTLLIVTADHASQTSKNYLGNGKTAKWGTLKNESPKEAPYWVSKLARTGEVKFSLQDASMRVWLKSPSKKARQRVIENLKQIPGVTEIFSKDGNSRTKYRSVYRAPFTPVAGESQRWQQDHAQELVDAVATPESPDLLVLLTDGTGFDLLGEHGGAQERVQRIPLLILDPRLPARSEATPVRLWELRSLVLRYLDAI